MSNTDSNRWIRTALGYAGRNGYLIREGHKFRAYSYDGEISGTIYDMATDAKKDLDSYTPSSTTAMATIGPDVAHA